MLKVEHLEVWGFEHAIRGMRNPMNSWDKSDSLFHETADFDPDDYPCRFKLGENDLALMQKLFKAGTDHRKFMRQITVSLDITAPLYWWKEFDTYKVGTVANSCSTMHKITAKPFTIDDFSHEHLLIDNAFEILTNDMKPTGLKMTATDLLTLTCNFLNGFRDLYLQETDETVKKIYWWQLIQLLPSSYDQKRTITMSYENAADIVRAREGHKQDEWRDILVPVLLRELPHFARIIGKVLIGMDLAKGPDFTGNQPLLQPAT